MYDLVLRQAALGGQATSCDIAIAGEHIVATAPHLTGSGHSEWFLDGRIVLPALVDPHGHLDKAHTLPIIGSRADLTSAIAAMAAIPEREIGEDRLRRGAQLLDDAVSWGVGLLRTHVNVDPAIGLRAVEAALALRERYRGRIRVQIVALVSSGVQPSRPLWDLLEEAVHLGCEAIGGSIGSVGDPGLLVDGLFSVANRHNVPLDLHVDEHTLPRCPGLEYLIRAAVANSAEGRVVAGHCCALGVVAEEERSRLIAGLKHARITVAALPLTNLYLQGRGEAVPMLRGIAPVRVLLQAGVRVICGSDNVQDAFLPYGNADPMLAAFVLGVAGHLTSAEERQALVGMVTSEAAEALGVSDYGTQPGCRADLVVLDARPPASPVGSLPPRHLVIHGGQVVLVPSRGIREEAGSGPAGRRE